MKIAISTTGSTTDSLVELRFGRASSFLIYDTDTQSHTVIDNTQQLNAAQGAGIQAAGHIINFGADILISGHCGPKAMKVLKSSSIKVFLCKSDTVQNVITAHAQGDLTEITEADVEEHWV